jgi:hypothetical protein
MVPLFRNLLLSSLILLVLSEQGAAQRKVQFDFRGLRMGDSASTELSSDVSEAHCTIDDEETQDSTCYLFDDHVGEVETDIGLSFASGKLISVLMTFDSDDYPTMAAAFQAKYGRPHRVSHETVSTAMGARYQNEILLWRTTSGDLTVARYGSTVSEGYASITSPVGLRTLEKREAKQRREAKEDL